MTISEQIGFEIKILRTQKKMTQEELSKAADITSRYVIDVEHGKKDATIGVLSRISVALGIRLSELIKRAEKIE